MIDLENKIVVLTGAANGLGKALATEFYSRGCHLALLDMNFTGLEKVKNENENSHQKIKIHQAKVSNKQNITDTRSNLAAIILLIFRPGPTYINACTTVSCIL